MRAELAGLTDTSARRWFAFGCATVVPRQVSVLAAGDGGGGHGSGDR